MSSRLRLLCRGKPRRTCWCGPLLELPGCRWTGVDCPSAFQALLLPQYWSSFIRSGSLEDVRPLGLGAKL